MPGHGQARGRVRQGGGEANDWAGGVVIHGVVIHQGDIWWAELTDPSGSEPGYRRPVVVVQSEALNRSLIATVVCVALTSNLGWAKAPGNVLLTSKLTGLPKDSVANASQILTLDKGALIQCAGNLPSKKVQLILDGIDIVLGR